MSSSWKAPNFQHLAVPWVVDELKSYEQEYPLILEDSRNVQGNEEFLASTGGILSYDGSEFQGHKLIGTGAFSSVYKVSFSKSQQSKSESDGLSKTTTTLALKCLRLGKSDNQENFVLAAQDIYIEATILARLNHPNIIRLRGLSDKSLSTSFFGKDDTAARPGFFLLLDLLQETLHDRLGQWRKQHQPSFFRKVASSSVTDAAAFLEERLETARQIAQGMNYLHQEGIVLRDLKPENIGFDARDGSVKLFDLGLARPVEACFATDVIAGSFRFMAPENLLCQPSGFPSDVYSYGVLLWEMMTLQRPYAPYFSIDKTTKKATFDMDKFTTHVIQNEWRPPLGGVRSLECRRLIQECWASAPSSRPTFSLVIEQVSTLLDTQRVRVRHEAKQRRFKPTRGSRSPLSGDTLPSIKPLSKSKSFRRSVSDEPDYITGAPKKSLRSYMPQHSMLSRMNSMEPKLPEDSPVSHNTWNTASPKTQSMGALPDDSNGSLPWAGSLSRMASLESSGIFLRSMEALDPICSGDERSSSSFTLRPSTITERKDPDDPLETSSKAQNKKEQKHHRRSFSFQGRFTLPKKPSARGLLRKLSSSSKTASSDFSESDIPAIDVEEKTPKKSTKAMQLGIMKQVSDTLLMRRRSRSRSDEFPEKHDVSFKDDDKSIRSCRSTASYSKTRDPSFLKIKDVFRGLDLSSRADIA